MEQEKGLRKENGERLKLLFPITLFPRVGEMIKLNGGISDIVVYERVIRKHKNIRRYVIF